MVFSKISTVSSILISFIFFTTQAQEIRIIGKVVDQETHLPLESATIFVEKVADSTLVAYTISGKDGNFVIESTDKIKNLRFISTFAGYEPYLEVLKLEGVLTDLGEVRMKMATTELGEVNILSERAPVTVKSDTLEFNAASFNTRQDANLEEVMKKLPGVEVDAQGNITVNGKPVSRILVNGKEFFGNDPKIATKNLPKEIIDKIQVVDTKTKSQEFTGKQGNPDDKTINVTIKEDKNKGFFSRATAGGGTDERYELSGIANYFKNDLRVSVLASSNNINSSGFSFDEVYEMMGRRRGSIRFSGNGAFSINGNDFGSGGGITKSETAGLNFSNDWNKKYELTADYFFGKNDTETRTLVQRETFLPDRTFYTNSISTGNLINESHRASAAFEVEIDSLTKISVRPAINVNDGFSQRASTSERIDNERELLTNTFDGEDLSSKEFSNQLDVIKKFGSRGAYLQVDFNNQNETQNSENFFFSELFDYEGGVLLETAVQDQFIDEENTSDEYEFGITQRSVLAEKLFLDLSYDFSVMNMHNTRSVYEFDETTGSYSIFSELLSNNFEVKSLKHIPNAGISYEGKKWRVGFDIGLLNTSLKNEDFLDQGSFENDYNDLFLRTSMRYEMDRGKHIYASYRTDSEIPEVRELQPVPNFTNPLNIIVGNPQLQPEYIHRFNLDYNNFDFVKRSGINAFIQMMLYEDQIVPFSITNENLVTTTTYKNLDGGMTGYVGFSLSKRFKEEEREWNYRAGVYGNYNRQRGFSNGVMYTSNRYGFTPNVRFWFNYKDLVEINPRYDLSYVKSKYDISNWREEEYINHTLALEATTYWPKNVVFGNDISFNSYGNVAPGFDPTSLLWNMSLGYRFLNDDATLKVKVYDLLNENVSTRRSAGEDYIQDTEELILEQYVMLSFTYKLSRFGGKDPNRTR